MDFLLFSFKLSHGRDELAIDTNNCLIAEQGASSGRRDRGVTKDDSDDKNIPAIATAVTKTSTGTNFSQ